MDRRSAVLQCFRHVPWTDLPDVALLPAALPQEAGAEDEEIHLHASEIGEVHLVGALHLDVAAVLSPLADVATADRLLAPLADHFLCSYSSSHLVLAL